MEFLKNHYEKIVLSLVLIGLAGAAGWLALQSMSFRRVFAGVNKMAPISKPPPTGDTTTKYKVAMTNALAPQEVDFDGDHKIFNPEKILLNELTRELVPNGKIGPKNLIVRDIRPLRLLLKAEPRTVVGRSTLYVHYLAEYETTTSARTRWGKGTAREGRPIRLSGTVSRYKRIMLTVNTVSGDLTKPESIKVELELAIGAGLPEPISLVGTNIWQKEIEFEADLFYPPLNREFAGIRVNYPLMFAGDTNTIIQMTPTEVTLRATSNQKRTTLAKKMPEPVPAAIEMPGKPAEGEEMSGTDTLVAPSDSKGEPEVGTPAKPAMTEKKAAGAP
jgi:hypothetical protein